MPHDMKDVPSCQLQRLGGFEVQYNWKPQFMKSRGRSRWVAVSEILYGEMAGRHIFRSHHDATMFINSEDWKNRYVDLQSKYIRSAPVFSVLSPKFGQTLDFARLQDGLIFRFDSVRGRSLRENLRCCYILVGCRYYRVIQSHTENRFIEHRRRILGFWWARPPPILSVPLAWSTVST